MNGSKKRSIAEMSADVRFLMQHIVKHPEGSVLTYEELSEVVQRDVQKSSRGVLYRAVRCALSHHAQVWECIPRVGIKRLENGAIPASVGAKTQKRVRSATRRGLKQLRAVIPSELTNEEKVEFHLQTSMLGAIHNIASDKAEEAIRARVIGSQTELPINRILEALRKD